MRQLNTAGLAATVALALVAMAHAATPQGTIQFNGSVPRLTGPANAAPPASTTTTTNTAAPQNTTTVDTRAQQNRQAVASTFASGSTSSLGPLAGTSAVTFNGQAGAGTTGGAGATGTTTGGTTAGGTTTGALGGGVGAFGSVGTAVGFPIYANPADVTTAGNAPVSLASNATPTFTNADIYANSLAVTEAQVNDANVNRAIAQVSRDRKRVGRNGQLLYSIAPRTSVDRTAQMPDDGPSPALTGSNSTLTR